MSSITISRRTLRLAGGRPEFDLGLMFHGGNTRPASGQDLPGVYPGVFPRGFFFQPCGRGAEGTTSPRSDSSRPPPPFGLGNGHAPSAWWEEAPVGIPRGNQ